jgi:hypothetical protein
MWADGNPCAVSATGDELFSEFKVRYSVGFIHAQLPERHCTVILADGMEVYERCGSFIERRSD